jgi:hypothetical protein
MKVKNLYDSNVQLHLIDTNRRHNSLSTSRPSRPRANSLPLDLGQPSRSLSPAPGRNESILRNKFESHSEKLIELLRSGCKVEIQKSIINCSNLENVIR